MKNATEQLSFVVKQIAAVNAAVQSFNLYIEEITEKVENLKAELEAQQENIAGLIQDLEETVDEVTSAQQSYYDSRSQKWQESDSGEAYHEWKEQWEDLANAIPQSPEVSLDFNEEEAEEVDSSTLDEVKAKPQC